MNPKGPDESVGALLHVRRRVVAVGEAETPICAFCGTRAPGHKLPLTWSTAVENGVQRHFCERCSREHLRAMESKLDSAWW
jgi:hypothetical protein